MTKIFKQLARHWAVCLVVFALLFVQAYCDLSLPDYTSKIVDTGIQQGGIESPLPDTVRQSTLDALSLLMREEDAAAATSISLVFLSALLTALNLYNKLARFGGAGTLVPITGFANAVVSPAIDFRAEGIVTGTAAKMFVIAGPVIVFGTAASALYGLILWLVG